MCPACMLLVIAIIDLVGTVMEDSLEGSGLEVCSLLEAGHSAEEALGYPPFIVLKDFGRSTLPHERLA